MPNGNPIIIESVEIGAAGFVAGAGTSYDLMDMESIAIGNERGTTTVDDNQLIVNWLDASFEFNTYNLDVLVDANVGTNSIIPEEAKIILYSAGGSLFSIDNVRIFATRGFDADREYALVTAQRRGTASPIVVTAV